jgi:hypothetical protein
MSIQTIDPRDVAEAHLFEGLTEGAKIAPETLFSSSPQLVVDASHVNAMIHDGVSIVPVAEIFSNPNATFLGFGTPNVFLSLPRSKTLDREPGWDKFAAFMYWRQRAYVTDTKGRVQGGVFVELRNIPPEALESLRKAMSSLIGRRTISCANATGRVLTAAGFTCNGRSLSKKVRPMTLAKAIWDGGLEYNGESIELRVIRTTEETVSDHFLGVLRKESTSLFRVVKKVVIKASTKNTAAKAPVIEPRLLPAATIRNANEAGHLELRVGKPTKLAALLRLRWGSHPIFEAKLDPAVVDVNGPDFADLHAPLQAYPGKLDAVSKVKRYVLFSKPVIKTIRYQMAGRMDSLGRLPGPTLVDMFQVGTVESPFLYNVVITGTCARMCRLENRTRKDMHKANWVLAKHVLLSGYDPDVRYAGEIWVHNADGGRVLHINNNSGTYKPSILQADTAARFLRELTGVPVEFHAN